MRTPPVELLPPGLFADLGVRLRERYAPVLADLVLPVYILNSASVVSGGQLSGAGYARTALIGAAAATLNQAQCKNPAGSGKTVLVDQITGFNATAQTDNIVVSLHDADLAVAGNNLLAKDRGQPESVAQLRTEQNAIGQGTAIAWRRTPADNTAVFRFDPPIILGPGEGVLIRNSTVNIAFGFGYEIREI